MSCITVPKQWTGATAAAPRVEAVLPTAVVRRRITKKVRATPQLVDSVREVVQAFEFEYAQTRADSVMLKTMLDERRTQLSDLRRHLEKESSENGTLEAVVQHRNTKNEKGDVRLAALEHDFALVVESDKIIAAKASAFESDMVVAVQEHRRIREMTSKGALQLDCAGAALDERERVFMADLRENERLRAEVERGRKDVDKKQCLVRSKQEKAVMARSLAKEAKAELEDLSRETDGLRDRVVGKDSECNEAVVRAGAIKREETEVKTGVPGRYASSQNLIHHQ